MALVCDGAVVCYECGRGTVSGQVVMRVTARDGSVCASWSFSES